MKLVEKPVWTVPEAKSRLSEILRSARKEGPQQVGSRDPCVIISKDDWEKLARPAEPLGRWLVQHTPKVELPVPARGQSQRRSLPFAEES